MTDWQDRWVDAGLQELHGSRPPDLSARVVLALQAAPSGPLPELQPPSPRRASALRWLLAAAALVLLGVAAGALLPRDRATEVRLVHVDLRVHDGALQSVEIETGGVLRAQHRPGTHGAFAPRAGNRLLAAEACRFQVGPFGELATGPATELEVRSMTVSWQHGVFAASTLTLAVVAGVVTWHSLGQSGTARAGEVVHLEAGDVDGNALAAENARLRERLKTLEQHNSDLQSSMLRERAPAPVVEEPPPPPPEPEPAVASGPVFEDANYADVLAKLDFKLMGEVTNEMGPMLVELAKAMQDGKELPMDVVAKIQELNSKLVAQVPALMKSGLPGSGPNGAYTHPLVSANILAKTLEAAGLAMDSSQRDKIAGLVRAATAENQSVADASQDFELQRLAAEAETKDRFYREVGSMLTPEQFRVMYPEGADAFDGTSLFHSSLFTRQFTDTVPASNPGEFARSVSFQVGEQLGFDEAASGKVRDIVQRVMSQAPELWQDKATKVETDLHMLRPGRATAAMQRQLEVMREVLRTVPMTADQRKKFTSMKHLFVPLPR